MKNPKRTPVADKQQAPKFKIAGEAGTLSLAPFQHDQETLTDQHLTTITADSNKWQTSPIDYSNVVMAALTKEQAKTLFAPWDNDDFLIHPTLGAIYIPAAKIKDRLTEAFGPLRWRSVPLITPEGIYKVDGNRVYVICGLVVAGPQGKGVIIDVATGVGVIIEKNPQSNIASACQMAQTYALKAHAQNIGMVTATRDSGFFEEYKRKNCVQVWVQESKNLALRWRRKWDAPFLGEVGELGAKLDNVPFDRQAEIMGYANVRPVMRIVKEDETLTAGNIKDVMAVIDKYGLEMAKVLLWVREKYSASRIREIAARDFAETLDALTVMGVRKKFFKSLEHDKFFEELCKALTGAGIPLLSGLGAACKKLGVKMGELPNQKLVDIVKATGGRNEKA